MVTKVVAGQAVAVVVKWGPVVRGGEWAGGGNPLGDGGLFGCAVTHVLGIHAVLDGLGVLFRVDRFHEFDDICCGEGYPEF